jgi:hypothetical protein
MHKHSHAHRLVCQLPVKQRARSSILPDSAMGTADQGTALQPVKSVHDERMNDDRVAAERLDSER